MDAKNGPAGLNLVNQIWSGWTSFGIQNRSGRTDISVTVHRIPTTVGTEILLTEPFTYAKFQPDWSTHSCFMGFKKLAYSFLLNMLYKILTSLTTKLSTLTTKLATKQP